MAENEFNGNINFTTVSENSISGEFSTTSEAGYEYSGSFEPIFLQEVI